MTLDAVLPGWCRLLNVFYQCLDWHIEMPNHSHHYKACEKMCILTNHMYVDVAICTILFIVIL